MEGSKEGGQYTDTWDTVQRKVQRLRNRATQRVLHEAKCLARHCAVCMGTLLPQEKLWCTAPTFFSGAMSDGSN